MINFKNSNYNTIFHKTSLIKLQIKSSHVIMHTSEEPQSPDPEDILQEDSVLGKNPKEYFNIIRSPDKRETKKQNSGQFGIR